MKFSLGNKLKLRSLFWYLLQTRMSEPCFNTLRTKQQLGYSVSCINHMTCGVIALGICVECKAQKFRYDYYFNYEKLIFRFVWIISCFVKLDYLVDWKKKWVSFIKGWNFIYLYVYYDKNLAQSPYIWWGWFSQLI